MEINKNLNNNYNNTNSSSGEYFSLNSSQNDKTFNRLRYLQSLIKKESALKELCKKIY